MNKSMLIRGGIMLGIFLGIIGAAVGCSMIDKDDVTPQISNPDEVYLHLDEFDVTNQELWEIMKNVDGLNYLMDYVDEIILADYIATITQDEIDQEVSLLTYQTEDADLIAEIQADPERDQEYIDAFRQNLVVMGYDPQDPDDMRAFVELTIAKIKYLEDLVADAPVDDYFEITDEDLEQYYEQIEYNDACAVEVRFNSATEAYSVFDLFNLVPNYNTGFGEYFGTDPIEDVASDDFDETNTTQLTDDEVFTKYIEMYNYMNPWMPQIPTDITQEDYCNDYSDVAIFNYEDLTKNKLSGDPNITYAAYLFSTLDLTAEEMIPYSYSVQTFGLESIITYKISEEPRTPFEDISEERRAELVDDLTQFFVTDENLGKVMQDKRDEIGLEIFDPLMKLKYEYTTGISFDNEGDDTLVAKLGDTEITVDDLYSYMEERVGTFYSLEITKVKWLIQSDAYEEVYGTDRDYMNNDSEKMVEHREELRNIKSIFGSNGYASYGFSSNDYTWEEFLYLAFTATSENQVLEQLFIVGNLQPDLIYPTLSYDSVAPYIQDQVDNYFSLDVDHILMYVDFDNDFQPDSFDDLLAGFNAEEETEYNSLKVAFENLVIDKYNSEGLTLTEIVDEFNDSLMEDPDNEWAIFKQYGFRLLTESLTPDGQSLTYVNSTNYDESFTASLKRIYDVYVRPENAFKDEYVDTQLTTSDFGLHLIVAYQGTDFEQPTAFFEADPINPDAYSEGSENPNMTPSESQILLYNSIKFAGMKGVQADYILPSNVYQAIDAYYLDLFNAYFTQTGYSLVSTEFLLDSNPVYTYNNTDHMELLAEIVDALYAINFPEEFVRPTD